MWIDPWVAQLQSKGVRFHEQTALTEIKTTARHVSSVTVSGASECSTVTADYYVFAVPVEVMARFVTPAMKAAEPRLAKLDELAAGTTWMNGIQFFLNRQVPVVRGHVIYQDAPYALTSVSKAQFWRDFDDVVKGPVKDILSVDISDWETPGHRHPEAKKLTAEQVKEEVWSQLQRALNRRNDEQLPDACLHRARRPTDAEREPGAAPH